MFKRLIQWLKNIFQSLFGVKPTPAKISANVQQKDAPPLNDTDLEFLFSELLEGVNQARGQAWALKWLHNIEHRVSTERWLGWLRGFGDKLMASTAPNNELASRLIQLGELDVGEVGDLAYDIGMDLITRNQQEPIWEYSGPDTVSNTVSNTPVNSAISPETTSEFTQVATSEATAEANPDGDFQTITLDQLYELMQQDDNLRQIVAQQVGIESDNPEDIIQALVDQFQATEQVTDQTTETNNTTPIATEEPNI
ncbi:hypothetical protein [Calothrix sp. UHCC 0171]|uniref:hypothetical protein n=1 Tax=Calothrix sp. UHCC 0171 TaxID=3110245 RepID=UPI002B21A336|nr:hypothetical protein [Calothrix sp. UHCC 0171]MEA5569600.1 hypothetical protein [Calothrix sp. UHCC 0171]